MRVDERDAGSMPTLAEIRPVVQREWESEQRRNVNDALLARLRAKYEVRVEGPAAGLFAPGPRPPPAQGSGGAP